MTNYTSSAQSPPFSLLMLEDYLPSASHPEAYKKASLIILELLSDSPSSAHLGLMEWAAKTCIEANKAFDTLGDDLKRNMQNIKELLTKPPKQIFEPISQTLDPKYKHIYQHLFCSLLSNEIDASIETFKTALSFKEKQTPPPEIDQPFTRACEITKLAIQCFACLEAEVQANMKNILTLLTNLPGDFVLDRRKLKIFNETAGIFADINPKAPTPPRPLLCTARSIPTINQREIEEKKQENGLKMETQAPLPGAAPNSSPIDIPADPGIDSALILPLLTGPKIKSEDLSCRKQQYRTIHLFGRDCLLDYGPYIVERGSATLLEIFSDPKNCNELVAILMQILGPYIFGPGLFAAQDSTAPEPNPACAIPKSAHEVPKLGLIRRIAQKAMPDIVQTLRKTLLNALNDPSLGPELVSTAMEYLTPLCFIESPASPQFKKNLLLHILKSAQEFFKDLNACLEEAGKTHKEGLLNVMEEEKVLIHLMNKKLIARNLPQIVPCHANPSMVRDSLLLELQDLLKSFMGIDSKDSPTAKQKAILFIAPFYLRNIVDRILSPETLCIVIDRVLENPINLNTDGVQPAPTPKMNKPLDSKYTENMAVVFHELFREVIKMGGTPDVLKAIVSIVDPLIKSQLQDVAKGAHQALEELMSTDFVSDTVITPLLIIDQLLYNKEEIPSGKEEKPASVQRKESRAPSPRRGSQASEPDKRKPSLTSYMGMTPPEFDKVRSRVDESIKKKPYGLIKYLIDTHLSFPARVALKALPVESVCQNLTNRLYRLSQQEMLMKIMFSYIKKGVCEAANQPK